MRVVLFDIDGTILWTDGAGRRAVHRALEDVFGAPVPDGHEFDGKTDPQIVRELMHLAGSAHGDIDGRIEHALERYVELLHTELGALEEHDHVLPGIRELLDALEARDDVLLGLLTGNVHPGAVAKLTAVGIDATRFRIGAFGSDHAHRPELPAIARQRAEALLGRQIAGSDVVVIGDTPADMGCGRGIGARAIGVATGRYSVEDLRACGAAAVFADLSDTDAAVGAIMGG
ncbi:MAG TPA: HAD family hydrolase [Gemmatimonadaceae bacterium]|nr:HAD family hydrolase [Gemmatimonadaceae bacterium]